ncbi:hypothetical protein EJB05_37728, partial [Eragrostis curvula]
MSSSVPDQEDPGSGAPVAWWNAASPVGSDVVLSGAVLLFMALAFAFVLYHYFTVSRRCGQQRDGSVRTVVSSSSSGGQLRTRGTVGGDAVAVTAVPGVRGGVSPALLRALPLTVYSAKDRAGGEALECAVCLADVADGEAARFLPRCGHGFHAECVDLWLRGHSTCPLCRVDVGKADASLMTTMPPAPLPPALPEPANYPTNLPTNVLFWGSQDAVTTIARTAGAGAVGSPRSSTAALVIEVRDRETAAPAAASPREGGAAKPLGLARLSSLRRLWNRGRPDEATASSSRSCRRGDGTERTLPSPLDIWNVT